jgi:hypothetical protein
MGGGEILCGSLSEAKDSIAPKLMLRLGYFDSLADGMIRPLQDGRKAFYPFGLLVSGYIIPSDAIEAKIRRRIKSYFLAHLCIIIVLCTALNSWLSLLSAARYLLWVVSTSLTGQVAAILYYYPVIRRLERTQEKQSFLAAWSSMGARLNPVLLWILMILSFIFALMTTWFYVDHGDFQFLLSSLFCTFIWLFYLGMIYYRKTGG